MRYTLLGNSGLRVSEVARGTMTFGTDWGWGASAGESAKQFELFAEAGGTLIDRANKYTNGTAESILSDLLATDRDHFVLGTKYSLNARDGGRWRRVRAARYLDVASLRDRRPLWPGARFRSSDGRHLPEKEPTGRVCGGGAGLVAGPGANWSASIRELAGGLKAATGTAVPSASRGSAMFARSSRSASTASAARPPMSPARCRIDRPRDGALLTTV